jgi:hypothetical protein
LGSDNSSVVEKISGSAVKQIFTKLIDKALTPRRRSMSVSTPLITSLNEKNSVSISPLGLS